MKEIFKIGIFGLGNAGKTSLIKSLMQEYDIISSLKPTKGSKRNKLEFLGREIYFWDFGGQEKYRARYLNSPLHYFDSYSHVFYVVDIQDTESLDINILYFRLIMKELLTYSPNSKYTLLYHKSDPDFIKKNKPTLNQDFYKQIEPFLINECIELNIHKTSIFNPFGIISAFSKPFLDEEDIYTNISMILRSFVKEHDVEFGILFTKRFFEVGHYKSDPISDIIFGELLKVFLEEYDPLIPNPELNIGQLNIKILTNSLIINFGKIKLPFYLVIGISKKKEISLLEKVETNMLRLSKNIKKLLFNTDLTEFIQSDNNINRNNSDDDGNSDDDKVSNIEIKIE